MGGRSVLVRRSVGRQALDVMSRGTLACQLLPQPNRRRDESARLRRRACAGRARSLASFLPFDGGSDRGRSLRCTAQHSAARTGPDPTRPDRCRPQADAVLPAAALPFAPLVQFVPRRVPLLSMSGRPRRCRGVSGWRSVGLEFVVVVVVVVVSRLRTGFPMVHRKPQ
jgi:hypothetical protein